MERERAERRERKIMRNHESIKESEILKESVCVAFRRSHRKVLIFRPGLVFETSKSSNTRARSRSCTFDGDKPAGFSQCLCFRCLDSRKRKREREEGEE